MLEWMQKHKKYLVVTVWISALALIFASMVEWGGGGFSAASYDSVAKVGNIYISRQEYQKRYYDIYNEMKQLYDIGDNGNRMLPEIEQIVFKELVQEKLLESLANDWDVSITPNEILSKLITIPEFQDINHNFDKVKYYSLLEANGRKAQEYEDFIANVLLYEKMQNFPISPISSLEVNTFLSASKIRDDVLFNIVDKQSVLKNVSIQLSDSDIRNYWDSNKDKYVEPQKYNIAYIAIDSNDFILNDDSIMKYYKDNSKQYKDAPFKSVENNVINDYKKAIISIASSYVNNISKDIKDKKIEKYDKIISTIDSNIVSILQKYLDNDLDISNITLDDIPIRYIQLLDNDVSNTFLLEQVRNADNLLSPIEYAPNHWIIPYVVEKIQEKTLSFEQAKEKAQEDLMQQKENEEFKKNVQAKFANINSQTMNHSVSMGILDLQMKDKSESYRKFSELGLDSNDIRNIIDRIMSSDKANGFMFLDSNNKAILYKIVNQSMPSYNDLTNASNEEINVFEEAKIRDLRNALLEYATSRYKIIDYRRQN